MLLQLITPQRRFGRRPPSPILAAMAALLTVACAAPARSLERVTIKRDSVRRILDGNVLVEAQDGGLLLQTRDGVVWMCQPEEIESRVKNETPFQWLDTGQLQVELLKELPDGFRAHTTEHFLVCYNTTEIYARWCGSLYERLFDAYFQYWERQGIKLKKPEHPLVAVIHRNQSSFAKEARKELGDGANVVVGYYSMRTNRVNMYDLTGADGLRPYRGSIRTRTHINQILSQPGAERTVATIVHEATHQLAYNSGLQTRYAGSPFWVSEGLAVFFESPDLKSSRGWRGIGAKHRTKLVEFRRGVPTREADALQNMLTEDAAFRQASTAGAAYANAWAFNYYLLRRRSKEYVAYLRKLAELKPLEEPSAEQRLKQFEDAMGMNVEQIEREFLNYMHRVR